MSVNANEIVTKANAIISEMHRSTRKAIKGYIDAANRVHSCPTPEHLRGLAQLMRVGSSDFDTIATNLEGALAERDRLASILKERPH